MSLIFLSIEGRNSFNMCVYAIERVISIYMIQDWLPASQKMSIYVSHD